MNHLLGEVRHDVLFIVLNYDNLLEKAISRYAPSYGFNTLRDYVGEGRIAKVVKLHGSIDWFVHITRDGPWSWDDTVRRVDVLKKPQESSFIIKPSIASTRDVQDHGQWLYPVVTAPLAGKRLDDVVCPDSHVQAAGEFLSTCDKFLIIGTSGLDQDLFELLNSALPSGLSPTIHVVSENAAEKDPNQNPDREALKTLDNFKNGVPALDGHINQRHHGGFSGFVSGGEWRAFAEA